MEGSTLQMPSGSKLQMGDSWLKTGCATNDTPAWTFIDGPTALTSLPARDASVKVPLQNVPATCNDIPMKLPCAPASTNYPAGFICTWSGNAGQVSMPPVRAEVNTLPTNAVEVFVNCNFPAEDKLYEIIGFIGDGSTYSTTLSLSYERGESIAIPFAGMVGEDMISISGLPEPPSAPSPMPPPSPNPPPAPAPPPPENAECKRGSTISKSLDNKIVICHNPGACEQDAEDDCPNGYHLCGHTEFKLYNNAGFTSTSMPASPVLGAIYCRSSGAGHYSISSITDDRNFNCDYGSSLPWCTASYGCNEKNHPAVCCVDSPQCGDGIKQSNEDCDNGGSNAYGQACSPYCVSRNCY